MAEKLEVRTIRSEARLVRSAGSGLPAIEGYAALFGTRDSGPFTDLGSFREVVNRSAFSKVLRGNPRVLALFNHDSNYPLATTTNKSLALSTDSKGLHFRMQPSDTSYARDLVTLIREKNISGCSYGFLVGSDDWTLAKNEMQPTREITEVEQLVDISVTTFPAQPDATCDVRSLWPDGKPSSVVKPIARMVMRDRRYSPDQPRDPDGKFGSGGASPESVKAGMTVEAQKDGLHKVNYQGQEIGNVLKTSPVTPVSVGTSHWTAAHTESGKTTGPHLSKEAALDSLAKLHADFLNGKEQGRMRARSRKLLSEFRIAGEECDCECEGCQSDLCMNCSCVDGCDATACGSDSCQCAEHRSRLSVGQGRTIVPAGTDRIALIEQQEQEHSLFMARWRAKIAAGERHS